MSRTVKKKGRRTEKRDKEIEKMRSACIKLRQEVKLAEEMAAEAQAAAGVGPGAAAEASEERRAAKRKSLIKLQAMNPQKHLEASLRLHVLLQTRLVPRRGQLQRALERLRHLACVFDCARRERRNRRAATGLADHAGALEVSGLGLFGRAPERACGARGAPCSARGGTGKEHKRCNKTASSKTKMGRAARAAQKETLEFVVADSTASVASLQAGLDSAHLRPRRRSPRI
jgi:hypothetical protein